LTSDKPIRAEVLGVKLAIFRDKNGSPRVISDICVHRGASLGKGMMKDGNVLCPYHGWAYNGEGKCVHIPSIEYSDEQIPSRAKVDSYPVQEKYGIIFAFLGDLPEAERPPIWEVEEYTDPAWRCNDVVAFEVNYYYERSVENGLDPSHNQYVHPNQGAPVPKRDYRKDPIEIIKEEWASKFTLEFHREKKGLLGDRSGGANKDEKGEVVIAGSGHMGPNQLVTWIYPQEDQRFRQYFFEAPIDENRTKIFFLTTRSYMIDPDMDEDIMDINMAIAHEDIVVVQELDPIRTPSSPTKEMLMPTDAPALAYRQYLKKWEENGWKIDIKKYRELRGDVAMAIPSPERRNSKGWVIDTIPLVPAKNAV
jgi:phenylpropionate dioxygenase-like ring-hydroxylating dioxygenase large terminal subunit